MIFSRRKTIGVFLNKIFSVFDDAVFHALEREGRRLDYDIVIFTSVEYNLMHSDYDDQEKDIFRYAAVDKMDGIIVVPASYDEGEFRDGMNDMLRTRVRCPVVAIRDDDPRYDCVYTDETEAIRPLIRHLIEHHGFRHICFQTGYAGHSEADARLRVFLEEMEAHGLEVPESRICAGNLWHSCGDVAYDAFFSDPDNLPEAVVCANDYMAVGLMRTLAGHGIRVPQDVVVTGFDNIPVLGVDMPSVTTVQPDYDRMVVEAMNCLDRRIRGCCNGSEHFRIALPGRFVLGESCGCGKRAPDHYRRVSEEATALLELENDQDAMMNNMCIDLGACADLTTLHKVLISQRVFNPILRDHYICLFEQADALTPGTGGKVRLVHALRDQRDGGMPMTVYDRSDILPAMMERQDEPQLLLVKLLHQNGRAFGYNVFQYMPGQAPSRAFVNMNVLITVALENIRRQDELMRLYEERRRTSTTDMLTNLLNRRGLNERLEALWPGMMGRRVAFACVDMDRLKHINDTYGHTAGDHAIRLVGQAIQATLPPDGLGARMGGDEFVVFLPEGGGGQDYAGRLEETLERLNEEQARPFTVTASVGIFDKVIGEGDTFEHCIQAGDQRMYAVKEAHHARKAVVTAGK